MKSNYYLLVLVGLLLLPSTRVFAGDISVAAGQDLQQHLNNANQGDHLLLQPGLYRGNFSLNQSLTLRGQPGVIIDAGGQGNALTINAANVTIEGMTIRHWGDDLTDINAGIFIDKKARGTLVRGNRLQGDAFGIWVDATEEVQLLDNRIEGNPQMRSSDRGNGIHLYGVKGALVKNNEIWHSRDGIYIESSNGNELADNFLHDVRYGIHYMYSYHNKLINNHTRNTRTGYALMQSKFLTVINNRSENDQNYGILMNFITNSTLEGNRVEGVHGQQDDFSGSQGKAVFIYNSLFNRISYNTFGTSDLGIHLTAGSENNQIWANAFIGNRQQVKYVASRQQDWSHEGTGNYWSDYLGWDMDGDGIGDIAYEPNDGIDKLLWKYPEVKVLLNSPAIETLRWVQRQFPVLKSPGVSDSVPMMLPPGKEPSHEVPETIVQTNNPSTKYHADHSAHQSAEEKI